MMMCLFRKPGRWIFLDWRGYLVSIGAVGLATLIKYFARPDIITAPNSLPYIVAIVITAVHFGFGPAIFASFISVIIYDFFFAEPLNNFTLVGTQQITVLITFLLVGVIVSYLASSLRNRTEEAIRESTLRKQHEEELLKYRDHLEDLIKQRTAALEGTNLILKVEVAERKKAEESLARAKDDLETKVSERTRALTESEDKYRLLVENANEAVVVFQDNREKFINHKAIETLGYSAEELASTPISDFIHPDDRDLVVDRYLKRLQGTAVPSSYEFRMIHKSGRTLWVNINAVLIDWKGRPAVLALMTDITERKNLEQALKKYAERITRVQEEERKRIAYELHDDTAQYLSILKLQLDSLISSGKIRDPEVLRKLQFLEKDAGRAVDDVRRYSHELRPGVLEHLGLQAALEQIADDINKLRSK